jgi:hypothetical protein
MKSRVLLSIAFASILSLSSPALFSQDQAQKPAPVFRANSDLVTIPVFVKGSGGAVAGLRPSDFVLTDNGVKQTVDSFTTEALPVDVTVLIETSYALRDYAKTVNEQVRRIAAEVRPTDRLEILGIDDYVNVLLPMGPPGRAFDVDAFARGGLMSVNDAIAAALMRQADPNRQHLVLVISDTIDTMSTLSMSAVREVARQSSATLYLTWVSLSEDPLFVGAAGEPPPWNSTSERLERHIRGASQRTVPRRQQWMPHYDPPNGRNIYAFDVLREAADLTGGGLRIGGFIERNASIIFNKFYAEFRRNYVLRYKPAGVDRGGWHKVEVSVPRYPRLDVRARHGYLIENERTTPAAPVAPPMPSPGSLDALVAAANRDDLAALRATVTTAEETGALSRLIADFIAAGNLWPATPRREFVTALLLADRAVRSSSPELVRGGIALLARTMPLVRPPLGPDEFERLWLSAMASLLRSAARPAEAFRLLNAALERVPNDPRLLLDRAVAADQFVTVPGEAGRSALAQAAEQLLVHYDAAIEQPTVAIEARILKAGLLRRLGRDREAEALLKASANTTDPVQSEGPRTFEALLTQLHRLTLQ